MCKTNIFSDPARYIHEIVNLVDMPSELVESIRAEHSGKSIMCAWITKLCPLKCANCFFRSNMSREGMIEEEYVLSDEGIDKLLDFVRDSNNSYLMLSGGGDPMVYPEKVEHIVREAETDRIVLVTSGFWGRTPESAEQAIARLHGAFAARKDEGRVELVVRLSVDSDHEAALGSLDPFVNIIEAFHCGYSDVPGFELMIHTMRDDDCVRRLAMHMGARVEYTVMGESDNAVVIKIVPQKARFVFPDGYSVDVGVSKLFLSDLSVDLRDPRSNAVRDAVRVMTDDIENSEQDNPGYVQNSSGKKGFDFWVDYNGNVTLWFNQDWEKLFNLYTDTYEDVVEGALSNPLVARSLKKGYEYRNSVVAEVDDLAVLRSKAINLRDYCAAFLLEEDKTKLYYGIRSLQGFVSEYWLDEGALSCLSPELQDVVMHSRASDLGELYQSADYDMTRQGLDESAFDPVAWKVLLHLIALGHYKVDHDALERKIEFYDMKTGTEHSALEDFILPASGSLNDRLHHRVSFMKGEALRQLKGGAE